MNFEADEFPDFVFLFMQSNCPDGFPIKRRSKFSNYLSVYCPYTIRILFRILYYNIRILATNNPAVLRTVPPVFIHRSCLKTNYRTDHTNYKSDNFMVT